MLYRGRTINKKIYLIEDLETALLGKPVEEQFNDLFKGLECLPRLLYKTGKRCKTICNHIAPQNSNSIIAKSERGISR